MGSLSHTRCKCTLVVVQLFHFKYTMMISVSPLAAVSLVDITHSSCAVLAVVHVS